MFENASHIVLLRLKSEEVLASETEVSSKTGSSYLSNYSMKEAKNNEASTIYVPGCAPKYKKHDFYEDGPLELPPDTGAFYMDEHAVRYHKQQYEPMVRVSC